MTSSLVIHYAPRLVEDAVFHVQRDRYVASDLDERRRRQGRTWLAASFAVAEGRRLALEDEPLRERFPERPVIITSHIEPIEHSLDHPAEGLDFDPDKTAL